MPAGEVSGTALRAIHHRAVLVAALTRLIPSDATGPGASEAQVVDYIARALKGELRDLVPTYEAGLEGIDARARAAHNRGFAQLADADQDALLTAIEEMEGDDPLRAFFELLREHAVQGFVGDPYHGGNAGFVGWDLIDFPGVKLSIPEQDQQLDVLVQPAHKSTADYPIFGLGENQLRPE